MDQDHIIEIFQIFKNEKKRINLILLLLEKNSQDLYKKFNKMKNKMKYNNKNIKISKNKINKIL